MFDIDLTDYDDVRTCGKEGHICVRCWPLMAAAVQARPHAAGSRLTRGRAGPWRGPRRRCWRGGCRPACAHACRGSRTAPQSPAAACTALSREQPHALLAHTHCRGGAAPCPLHSFVTRAVRMRATRCWTPACERTLALSTSCGCSPAAAAYTAGSVTRGAPALAAHSCVQHCVRLWCWTLIVSALSLCMESEGSCMPMTNFKGSGGRHSAIG